MALTKQYTYINLIMIFKVAGTTNEIIGVRRSDLINYSARNSVSKEIIESGGKG